MNNLAKFSVIMLSFLFFTGWTWENPFLSKAQEGNELYKKGKYDEALRKYTDAQVEDPNSMSLYYNIGNVFFQKKEYDKAIEEYKKSLEGEEDLQEYSSYNIGNACYRNNKFDEAIKYYINALKLNPDDKDAKYNLEMARKKLKEQQNQKDEKNQQNQKNQQDKQNQEDNNNNQNRKDREKNQDKQNRQDNKEQQDKEKKDDQKKPQNKQNNENEKMSEQDARMILNALEDEEKQKIKDKNNKEGLFFGNVEKDW